MEEKQITIIEALRFARHDFMNQLQLIRMNIELGLIEDAKTVIDSYASRMMELAQLNKLGLPKLYEFVQISPWIYKGLNLGFSGKGELVDEQLDTPSVELLDKLFSELVERLNPYEELECHIDITAVDGHFRMGITVVGEIENLDCAMLTGEQNILVVAIDRISPKEWKCIVTAR